MTEKEYKEQQLQENNQKEHDQPVLRSTVPLSSDRPLQAMKDEVAKKAFAGIKPKRPKRKSVRKALARLLSAKAPLMATQYQVISEDDLKRFKLPRKMLGKQITGKVTKVKVTKVRFH